jgi:Mannosylglycerate hydrolase MGH1-like glycoside hydrolase domain
MLWIGLVRLGYRAQAEEMARRLGEAALSQGLREYYHPRTGEGLGAPDFAWTSLILEMADPVTGAAQSYLDGPGP